CAADCLHLSALVHRSRDRQRLLYRHVRDARKQRNGFGAGRAVALDHAVALLERKTRRQRQRRFLGVAVDQEALQSEDGLGVDRPGESCLALEVDEALTADADSRGDTRRLAERGVAKIDY